MKESLSLFEENNLKVNFHKYSLSNYNNIHNNYLPELSILDLLANVDINEASNYF